MKNEADSLTYQIEKDLKEHKDKVPQTVADKVRADITNVNSTMASGNVAKIKESLEQLRTSAMEIGKSIYKTGQDAGQSAGAQGDKPGDKPGDNAGDKAGSSSTGGEGNTQGNTGSGSTGTKQ